MVVEEQATNPPEPRRQERREVKEKTEQRALEVEGGQPIRMAVMHLALQAVQQEQGQLL